MTHTEFMGNVDLASKRILAKNVEDYLYLKRLTLDELGRLCGSNKQYISKIKSQQTNPSFDFLDGMATAMECEVKDLFTEDFFKKKFK